MERSASALAACLPIVGRAGLGNELFPLLRSLDDSAESGAPLLPARWVQLKIGPWLRRERDTRQYWRLFRWPRPTSMLVAGLLEAWWRLLHRLGHGERFPKRVRVQIGMGGLFNDFRQSPETYRTFLRAAARPGIIDRSPAPPYIAAHIRLGDFAQAASDDTAARNNQATSLAWYASAIDQIREEGVNAPIYICSDGSDDELAGLLMRPGVARSAGTNALEDIFVLSYGAAILGSRSTFTAWGAFLGSAPLLVALGGNAYQPHPMVWEAARGELPDDFVKATKARLQP